jgi:hypothetical protein
MSRDVDHYQAARDALQGAEDGYEYVDRRGAPALYAQLGSGPALPRIAEALDRMGDDLDELKRREDISHP